MSWAAVVVGGISLGSAAISASKGKQQMDRAKIMESQAPQFQGNTNLQANADILQNRFSNYRLPGYSNASRNIDRAAEMGYRSVLRGAASSSDILDGATRIAYGSQSAYNDLNAKQAAGQDAALMDYVTANAQAGQEIAQNNVWLREQYLRAEQNRANLMNAGMANTGNAMQSGINTFGQLGGYLLSRPNNNNPMVVNPSNPNTRNGMFNYYSPGSAYNSQPVQDNPFLPQTMNS